MQSISTRITVKEVIDIVSRQFGLTPKQLLERTRRAEIAKPRQLAMFLATRYTNASLPDIGQRFGGFDHTTVIYARDEMKKRTAEDNYWRAEATKLCAIFDAKLAAPSPFSASA